MEFEDKFEEKVEYFLMFAFLLVACISFIILSYKVYDQYFIDYIVYDKTPVICNDVYENNAVKVFTNCEDGNEYINPPKVREIRR